VVVAAPNAPAVSAVQTAPLGTADPAKEPCCGQATGSAPPATVEEARSEPQESPDPRAAELCAAYCARLAERCSGSLAEDCETRCTQYQQPPGDCTKHIHEALACARDAMDLACVNIAPQSCGPKFRSLFACVEGRELPEVQNELTIPEGWQRVRVEGLSVAMPPEVEQRTDERGSEWLSREQGASYSVRVRPPPKQPPKQSNSTALTLGVLGNCNRELKVFSIVERAERYSNRFSATCPDRSRVQGHLLVTGGQLYVLTVKGALGPDTAWESFLFGFELEE
jgi:hypothetical protein